MKKRARGGVIIGLTCEYHTNGGAGRHHTKILWRCGAKYGGQIYSQGGEYGQGGEGWRAGFRL